MLLSFDAYLRCVKYHTADRFLATETENSDNADVEAISQILKLTYIKRGLRSSSRHGRIIKRTVFGFHLSPSMCLFSIVFHSRIFLC